jgi:hypothetical protein
LVLQRFLVRSFGGPFYGFGVVRFGRFDLESVLFLSGLGTDLSASEVTPVNLSANRRGSATFTRPRRAGDGAVEIEARRTNAGVQPLA